MSRFGKLVAASIAVFMMSGTVASACVMHIMKQKDDTGGSDRSAPAGDKKAPAEMGAADKAGKTDAAKDDK